MSNTRTILSIVRCAILCVAASLLILTACGGDEQVSHGRFASVSIIHGDSDAQAVVLFFTDRRLPANTPQLAARLGANRALVASIDTNRFLDTFAGETSDGCVRIAGDIDNLSRYIQASNGLSGYRPPILVGVGEGARVVRAALGQSEPGVFTGGLSLDMTATGAPAQPLCDADRPTLSAPWFVNVSGQDEGELGPLIADSPQAKRIDRPTAGNDVSAVIDEAMPKLRQRQASIMTAAPSGVLSDLPLIEVPATSDRSNDTMAIVLSGDGGWAGLDKQVGAGLAARGIPVVGYDSLRYYWTSRTPDEAARDLGRVMDYYRARWHKSRTLLIGYSYGADVLPFLVNRLPVGDRDQIARVILLGLAADVRFEFHIWSWLGLGDGGRPVRPEVDQLAPGLAVCIYGRGDTDSICDSLNPKQIELKALAGGHHFDGDYTTLIRSIMDAVPAPHALSSSAD
ncbi:AcvB/VirJ family lysyl-phosphatidylglycerol hydrolase [Salinisphaera sp. T31B1]|uniref:virulence factor family protein n=1 Tax=Salinisphaera sp. T31B1 TaxID=727963 RepID=UPI003342C546